MMKTRRMAALLLAAVLLLGCALPVLAVGEQVHRYEPIRTGDARVDVHTETAAILLKIHVEKKEEGSPATIRQNIATARQSVATAKKVGRNDPCPCGSGLKYKNCCGKNK